MSYGIPYMGSKQSIAKFVCKFFPSAENFYDLFGGGFSISHFMLQHRNNDFKNFHFNELRSGMTDLIKDAVNGKYNYESYKPVWVPREEFHREKENNLLIKLLWSFGNNGRDYLYAKEIEPWKNSLHQAIVFNEIDETAKKLLGFDGINLTDVRKRRLFYANQLQHPESLERTQQLYKLDIEKLIFYNGDYRQVPIKDNSIIYCDIPYKGTGKYDNNFDHESFYEWASSQKNPVYISEYELKDKRFKYIAKINKRVTFSATNNKTVREEKIFCNSAAYRNMI